MIDIVYFTFNRLQYTKKTLPALIKNAGTAFALTIIDNGSTDGTVPYLQQMQEKHGDIIDKILFNSTNLGLALPTNVFWKTSKAEFLGKVDNDTLVPKNWLLRLLEAHRTSDKLGIVGGFHFNMNYVNRDALEKRVAVVDGIKIVPDAFIGGCCYLFRKSLQERFGYIQATPERKTIGWTEYQSRICLNGYHNGYLYPLLHVDHFDDPLSKHNLAFTEHRETSTISMGEKNIQDRESQLAWYIQDAKRVERGTSLLQLGVPLRP